LFSGLSMVVLSGENCNILQLLLFRLRFEALLFMNTWNNFIMGGCTFLFFKIRIAIHYHYQAWKSNDIF